MATVLIQNLTARGICVSPEQDPISLFDILKGIGAILGTVAAGAWAILNNRMSLHESNHKDLAAQVRDIDTNMVTRDTFYNHETDVHTRLNEIRKESVSREDRMTIMFKEEFRDLRLRLDKVLDERGQR